MNTLVDTRGRIAWGIYADPVDHVNYLDYDLRTPMGTRIPKCLKQLMVNRFHFVGVVDPVLVAGIAVVDLAYLSSAFVYVYDRRTGVLTEQNHISPTGRGTSIAPTPENPSSRFVSKKLSVHMTRDLVKVASRNVRLSLRLDPSGTSPLRICTRAGYTRWVFTQKTSPVRLEGTVSVGGVSHNMASPSCLALVDWTCGYMRRETCWNWASTASQLPDGRLLGFNLSCGVNETSFTENAFWIDGTMTKVDTVNFIYEPDDLTKPWRVVSSDGRVDLSFRPETHRGEKISAFLIASRFTQLVGTFDGTLRTSDGTTVTVTGCPGFAEDHYARW